MALNKVIIMGRITHELELKQTQSGTAVLSFSVAVDRYSKDGEQQADFINCVAWGKSAEFIGKYFSKGRMIAITGNLHTRTYDDKNGVKHHITEVNVDSADFTGEPKPQAYAQNAQNAPYSAANPQGYNYTPAPSQAPQNAPQPPQGSMSNGYPLQSMNAVPKNNTAAEYAAFDVFPDSKGVEDTPF